MNIDDYTLDINGIIRDPGKFEAEHITTALAYDTYMDGVAGLDDDDNTVTTVEYLGIPWPVIFNVDEQGFVNSLYSRDFNVEYDNRLIIACGMADARTESTVEMVRRFVGGAIIETARDIFVHRLAYNDLAGDLMRMRDMDFTESKVVWFIATDSSSTITDDITQAKFHATNDKKAQVFEIRATLDTKRHTARRQLSVWEITNAEHFESYEGWEFN